MIVPAEVSYVNYKWAIITFLFRKQEIFPLSFKVAHLAHMCIVEEDMIEWNPILDNFLLAKVRAKFFKV